MKKIVIAVLLTASVLYCQRNKLIEDSKSFSNNEQLSNSIAFAENNSGEKKNPALAILYSALLPGMGELYAGDYSFGQYLTMAEAAFWGTYLGMKYYGNWKRDNYKEYAKSFGGVNLNGKDDDYFASIGEYSNIDRYNDDKALNRSFDEMYSDNTDYWKWQTESDRKTYRNMWLSSQHAFNNTRFVVGAMLLNRLVSIINAVRLTTAHNKSIMSDFNVYFNADPYGNSMSDFNINLVKGF